MCEQYKVKMPRIPNMYSGGSKYYEIQGMVLFTHIGPTVTCVI